MCAGLEGDSLFLEIEAGHERKVNPEPYLRLIVSLSPLSFV